MPPACDRGRDVKRRRRHRGFGCSCDREMRHHRPGDMVRVVRSPDVKVVRHRGRVIGGLDVLSATADSGTAGVVGARSIAGGTWPLVGRNLSRYRFRGAGKR